MFLFPLFYVIREFHRFLHRGKAIYICSTYNYANSFRFTYRHNQLLSPMQNYFWQSCLQVKVHAATNTCHKRSVNYKQNRCIFHNSFHPFSGGRTYVYCSSHLLVISPRTSAFEDFEVWATLGDRLGTSFQSSYFLLGIISSPEPLGPHSRRRLGTSKGLLRRSVWHPKPVPPLHRLKIYNDMAPNFDPGLHHCSKGELE